MTPLLWLNPNGRWFLVERGTDLFGAAGLRMTWGGSGRRGLRARFFPIASEEQFTAWIRRVAARRRLHGYAEPVQVRWSQPAA